MADIQHAILTDPQLHEPKGVASAAAGRVYISNGAGSGVWSQVSSANLQGLAGDGGSSNLMLQSNGSNGFDYKVNKSYGSMVVTNNSNSFAVSAAVDPLLATNSDYILYTGTGAPLAASGLEFGGVTFSTNRLTVGVSGIYKVNLWALISSFPSNTARVAIKYVVSGSVFSLRRTLVKSNSAGDYGNLSGFGLVQLANTDYLQLYIASSVSGGVIFNDLNLTLELIRPL
ncbi:hypothetical protein D3C87_1280850 [compost metagenome]